MITLAQIHDAVKMLQSPDLASKCLDKYILVGDQKKLTKKKIKELNKLGIQVEWITL